MGPNPMTSVLIIRKKTQAEKEKSLREDDLKMEAEPREWKWLHFLPLL